jgi:hypothetical protein
MSKSQQKFPGNAEQSRLFDLLAASDLSQRLGEALTADIRSCPLSRPQIADLVSIDVGRRVTKANIDAWTAASKPEHRIPADVVVSICRITGSHKAIEVLAGSVGAVLVSTPEDKAALAYGRNQTAKRQLLREEREIEAALDKLGNK